MFDPQIIPDPKTREIVRELLRRIERLETQQREAVSAVGTPTTDHGGLSGLGDDDHTLYLDVARHDTTVRHPWAIILKAGSSLADLTTRSASDLTSGTLPDGCFPATLPAASGANLTSLNADRLTAGTVPLAVIAGLTNAQVSAAAAIAWSKISKTASSLADLTTRSAGDLNSGTLPDARLSSSVAMRNANNSFTGYVLIGDILKVAGSTNLPASIGTSAIYMGAGYASPDIGRIFIGDGSGWKLHFSKRTGGVSTDLHSFQDNGNYTAAGVIRGASFNVSGTAGIDATVALAKLTPTTGTNGSLTITKGLVTAYTAPT